MTYEVEIVDKLLEGSHREERVFGVESGLVHRRLTRLTEQTVRGRRRLLGVRGVLEHVKDASDGNHFELCGGSRQRLVEDIIRRLRTTTELVVLLQL